MKRYVWLVVAVAAVTAGSSIRGQGRGQGGGRGGAQEERIDWNAKMPWGPIEKAVQARWNGLPRTDQKTEPFKIFDNLYYVGIQHVAAYLIPTNAGLILIDGTYADTADMVLDGIRTLKFDPATIKYIVITHSHFDHFAGVGRIKQVATGARIGTSAIDWAEIERQQTSGGRGAQQGGLPLARDLVINDGDTIQLGDSALKFYVTPGHSPGALALELRARAGGKTYRLVSPCVGLLNVPPELTQPYINSMERLKQLGPWDGVFASHAFLTPRDPYLAPRDFLLGPDVTSFSKRPHAAVQGAAVINAWFDDILKVAREKLAAEHKQP
jgi:glyoxylase-like metal-dependent hydrolase (beta-lactamase superfamily II)